MQIGDFFSTAPHAQPVNPRPVTFTATARGAILPGGSRNPTPESAVKAKVTAALVFIGGDEAGEARLAAREYVTEKCKDEDGQVVRAYDDVDLAHEVTYQLLQRILHTWDPNEQKTGGLLFDGNDGMRLLRKIVVPREARRVLDLYDTYVAEEHAEVVNDKTFRGAKGRGEKVAARAPR